jgi:hypothetical protein
VDGWEEYMKDKPLKEAGLDILERNCYLLKEESIPGESIEPCKAQWLLCVPPNLKLKNYTFSPTQCIYVFCVYLRTISD